MYRADADPPRAPVAARTVAAFARILPRGGFPFLRLACRALPALRRFPIELELLPGTVVLADLSESVWYPLWRHGCYPHQTPQDRLALAVLRPGDRVWDVGANIGYTSLLYGAAVGPTGSVLAFEPGRRAYAELVRTLDGAPNVRPLNLAISNVTGEIRFADEEYLDLSAVARGQRADGYVVPATTLDAVWSAEGAAPDFLKVDVEGHEREVFLGAAGLLACEKPIVQFEALDPDRRRESAGLLDRLSGGAYRIHRLSERGTLTALDAGGANTNDYVALSAAHLDRFTGLL